MKGEGVWGGRLAGRAPAVALEVDKKPEAVPKRPVSRGGRAGAAGLQGLWAWILRGLRKGLPEAKKKKRHYADYFFKS